LPKVVPYFVTIGNRLYALTMDTFQSIGRRLAVRLLQYCHARVAITNEASTTGIEQTALTLT
jgi:hypothetical protein